MYASGIISREEALANATSRNDLSMDLDYYDAGKKLEGLRKGTIKETVDKDILALKK